MKRILKWISLTSALLFLCGSSAFAAKRPSLELASAGAARPTVPASRAADLELPELYSLRIVDEEDVSNSGFVSTNPEPSGGGQIGGGHSGTLTWTLSIDDTTTECSVAGANCSQNVYRASGTCTQTSPVFTLLSNQSAAAVSYTDSTITPGTWCYAVTFDIQATESVKATAQVSLQAAPPTGLAVVVK